jgi:hypothetical protein
MAPSAGRHRASVSARPAVARSWTAVAVLCATFGIGIVLPVVLPVDPNWSPYSAGLQPAPAVRAVEPPPAEPLDASLPVSVSIAALDVQSDVVRLGLEEDGTMQVPQGAHLSGWYEESPTPGELGPSVLAAHVDWAGAPGAFGAVGDLRPGDVVVVERADGSTARFTVTRVVRVAKAAFPAAEVYGPTPDAELRLITCSGAFDRSARSYVDNLVIYAS